MWDHLFPYDRDSFISYETNEKGELVFDKKGKRILKIKDDKPIKEAKNTSYQKETLLALFQLALPELKSLRELQDEKSQICIDQTVNKITRSLSLIGSYHREKRYIQKKIKQETKEGMIDLFYREASLGHTKILYKILENIPLSLDKKTIQQALEFARKQGHIKTENFLRELGFYYTEKKEIAKEAYPMRSVLYKLQKKQHQYSFQFASNDGELIEKKFSLCKNEI